MQLCWDGHRVYLNKGGEKTVQCCSSKCAPCTLVCFCPLLPSGLERRGLQSLERSLQALPRTNPPCQALGMCFLSLPWCRDVGTPRNTWMSGMPGASGPWLLVCCSISSLVSSLQEKESALLWGGQQHRHLAFMCNFNLKSEKPSSVRGSLALIPPRQPPARGLWGASQAS